jgi:flagellar basal body rod protein FlgG
MSDIFAIAEAGMRESMSALDTISHNMANVSTHGFKRELHVPSTFEAHLQNAPSGTPHSIRDWAPGSLVRTGSALSFAIEGEGWFQLRSPQGIVLTRNGAFQLDGRGQLVSQHGWPVVLSQEASFNSATPTLSATNELWVDGSPVASFALAQADPQTLQAIGAGVFRATGAVSTDPESAPVRQGFLEGSNVDSLLEMVGVIESVRAAEASQRLMRAYDESLETAITTLGEF